MCKFATADMLCHALSASDNCITQQKALFLGIWGTNEQTLRQLWQVDDMQIRMFHKKTKQKKKNGIKLPFPQVR